MQIPRNALVLVDPGTTPLFLAPDILLALDIFLVPNPFPLPVHSPPLLLSPVSLVFLLSPALLFWSLVANTTQLALLAWLFLAHTDGKERM